MEKIFFFPHSTKTTITQVMNGGTIQIGNNLEKNKISYKLLDCSVWCSNQKKKNNKIPNSKIDAKSILFFSEV